MPYTITVSNPSTVVANNVGVVDTAPAGMSFGGWACSVVNAGAAPASTCPATLPTSGNLNTTVNLSAGAQLVFTTTATVTNNQNNLTNIASLALPAGATCVGGRVPCNASARLRSASNLTVPKQIPSLGVWGLLLVAVSLAGFALRRKGK